MFEKNVIYSSKSLSDITEITICAEIRHLIQTWRKTNNLPIDYVIPSVYVYFKNPIIKTALIEGICEANNKDHLFKLCQIDKVIFKELPSNIINSLSKEYDFYIWSALGGTMAYGDVIQDNPKSITDTVCKEYFTTYF